MTITFKTWYQEAVFEDLFAGTVFTTEDNPDVPCLKLEDEIDNCHGLPMNTVVLASGDLVYVDPDAKVYIPNAELILG